jgi:hypothetical protein
MTTTNHLDDRLVRALRDGALALPGELTTLRRYLETIDRLLGEKAAELEPTWAQALASAAEIETLQALEGAVAERAITVEAEDIGAVQAKIAIWKALAAGAPDGDLASPRNRLILSVERDLDRIARRSRA